MEGLDLCFRHITLSIRREKCVGKGPDSRLRDELVGYCCNPDGIQNTAVIVVKERKAYILKKIFKR